MNPITRFEEWLGEARNCKAIAEPTAMCLATVGTGGQPSARIVLLKAVDERGFVFYTNLESRKSMEIKSHPQAALCFYWMPLDRQVRVEGRIEPVGKEEADAYYASRPRESRIGAWASKQSRLLPSRDVLVKAVADYTKKFEGSEVPRPDFWSGWRLVPEIIEFWQQGDCRLHDRDLYRREGTGWSVQKLFP